MSLHKDIVIKVFYTIKERKYLSIRLIKNITYIWIFIYIILLLKFDSNYNNYKLFYIYI